MKNEKRNIYSGIRIGKRAADIAVFALSFALFTLIVAAVLIAK